MILNAFSNVEYVPKAYGNDKEKFPMKITMRALTAQEDMEIISSGSRDTDSLLERSIVSIKDPIQLAENGKKVRDVKVDDVLNEPALKALYFELVSAYTDNFVLKDEDSKN